MSKYLFCGIGLLALGLLTGCATGFYRSSCPCPQGDLSGKTAPAYQASPFARVGSPFYNRNISYDRAPIYNVNGVGPDFYSSYYGGSTVYAPEVAMRGARGNGGTAGQVYAGQYGGHYGKRAAVRPGASIPGRSGAAGRRAEREYNPYEGINPYANNPYAGNTVTRGPRDFLMSNPPNIGP